MVCVDEDGPDDDRRSQDFTVFDECLDALQEDVAVLVASLQDSSVDKQAVVVQIRQIQQQMLDIDAKIAAEEQQESGDEDEGECQVAVTPASQEHASDDQATSPGRRSRPQYRSSKGRGDAREEQDSYSSPSGGQSPFRGSVLAARGSEDAGGLLSHDQRLAEQEPEEMRRQQEHITAEEAVELARFSVKEIDHLQRKESINVAICVRQVKSREGGDTDGNAGGGLEKHDVSDEVAAYGKEEGGDRPEALEQDEWKKKYPSSAGIPSLRLSLFNGSVDSLILSYRNMEHDSEKEIDSISASFKDGLQGGQEYDAGGHGSVRKDKPPRHIASCAGSVRPGIMQSEAAVADIQDQNGTPAGHLETSLISTKPSISSTRPKIPRLGSRGSVSLLRGAHSLSAQHPSPRLVSSGQTPRSAVVQAIDSQHPTAARRGVRKASLSAPMISTRRVVSVEQVVPGEMAASGRTFPDVSSDDASGASRKSSPLLSQRQGERDFSRHGKGRVPPLLPQGGHGETRTRRIYASREAGGNAHDSIPRRRPLLALDGQSRKSESTMDSDTNPPSQRISPSTSRKHSPLSTASSSQPLANNNQLGAVRAPYPARNTESLDFQGSSGSIFAALLSTGDLNAPASSTRDLPKGHSTQAGVRGPGCIRPPSAGRRSQQTSEKSPTPLSSSCDASQSLPSKHLRSQQESQQSSGISICVSRLESLVADGSSQRSWGDDPMVQKNSMRDAFLSEDPVFSDIPSIVHGPTRSNSQSSLSQGSVAHSISNPEGIRPAITEGAMFGRRRFTVNNQADNFQSSVPQVSCTQEAHNGHGRRASAAHSSSLQASL